MDEQRIREIVREEIELLKATNQKKVVIELDAKKFTEAINAGVAKLKRTDAQGNEIVNKPNPFEKQMITGKDGQAYELPKTVHDLREVAEEMLHVLVKHEVLIDSLDRVLGTVREYAMTSTRIQEIWANDPYEEK